VQLGPPWSAAMAAVHDSIVSSGTRAGQRYRVSALGGLHGRAAIQPSLAPRASPPETLHAVRYAFRALITGSR
jgi:hypothetical protein